jgi:hypothetical protein
MHRPAPKIMGHHAPPPRLVRRTLWRIILIAGVPFLAFCASLDLLLYFLMQNR